MKEKLKKMGWVLLLCLVFYSCKKEVVTKNRLLTPSFSVDQKMIGYQEFLKAIDLDALGLLKAAMSKPNPNNRVMSLPGDGIFGTLGIYTDSVQRFNTNEGTSYVFRMALSSRRAVTFRNLTVFVNKEGKTSAFIATYTPTREWIDAWRERKFIRFNGDIIFTPLNLGSSDIGLLLQNDAISNTAGGNGKVMSIGGRKMVKSNVCYDYTLFEKIPVKCSAGLHYPGGPPCDFKWGDPDGSPPYWDYGFVTHTECFEVDVQVESGSGGSTPPSGGGGSTPNPPGPYDPCTGGPVAVASVGGKGDVRMSKLAGVPPSDCDSGSEGGGLYPLPPTQVYQLTVADRAILNELAQEDLEADEAAIRHPNDCYGTGRSGNVRWPGTAEHWLIQFDYVTTYTGGLREYSIPGAGPTGGRGYADLANMYTGEIFEIKPESLTGAGAVEAANYVLKANGACSSLSGAPFKMGTSYLTKYFRHPTRAGKFLEASLDRAGVIVYKVVEPQNNPQPVPVLLPQSLADKLKNFVNNLVQNTQNMEERIMVFLRENPEIVPYLKYAAAAIVVGTIIEDILTGGAGIADDWVSFLAARNIYRIAVKL